MEHFWSIIFFSNESFTLCFLRECKACLMVSYSSPCSLSVMDRQDESIFNLSSFKAAERKDFHSEGKDRACFAWGLCWSAGPARGFGLGLGVWGLEFRNLGGRTWRQRQIYGHGKKKKSSSVNFPADLRLTFLPHWGNQTEVSRRCRSQPFRNLIQLPWLLA